MNTIRDFWNKSIINKIIVSVVGFVCLPCVLCMCVIIALPTPASPTQTSTLQPVGNVFTSTFTPIPLSSPTLGIPTIYATFTEIPASTLVILPTRTPVPGINIANLPPCIRTTPQTGTVVDVVDGDTIKVRLDADGITYSVRYIGIDTPESTIQHEAYGEEASQKNTELVSGKPVTMFKDVSETDRYNRLLRYVFVGDMFINYELVKQGFANAVTYPPDVSCADYFKSGEDIARSLVLGLWALQPSQPSQPLSTSTNQASGASSVSIITVNKSAEYVDIKNTGSTPVNLNGWTLVSEKGNQRCSLSGTLDPGATLRIWAGTATDGGFSCGYGKNIWNNSESDPAVLYDAQGNEVDRY